MPDRGPPGNSLTRFDVDVANDGYAWWYLDALSDDGSQGLTLIAFLGSVFSPYYASARHRRERRRDARGADPLAHCAFNIALYGRDARWSMTERGRHDLSRDATHLAIGPSAMEWTGDRLHLHLDEVTAPLPQRIRGTIDLDVGVRPEHGVTLDLHGRHRWGVIAPCARIDVRLDAPAVSWVGNAYFDTNRGEAPLEHDFVGWNWSRAHLADGRSAVLYDVERRAGGALAIAHWFDAQGLTGTFEAPPIAPLPATRWGLDRRTRSDACVAPRVVKTFEDGPFYSRSVIEAEWSGQPVTSVHEHLSLERFERRWVRTLLPFRMPRRF
jgi:carotenoid 1,2-hydratase